MKRICFIFTAFILFSISPLFSQQAEEPGSNSSEAFAIIPNLEAEETKDIDTSRIKAIFNANVKSCRIYLNGNFQGVSKLTVSNLVEGFYLLRVEKNGYETQERFVYLERGKEKSFYIELEALEESQKSAESTEEVLPETKTEQTDSKEVSEEISGDSK